MSGDENPYASPPQLVDEDAPKPTRAPHVFLASFLGMQAGGMIGLVSAILSPLRYFIHVSSSRNLGGPTAIIYFSNEQILGECFFILLSTLILGLAVGAICEIGHWVFVQRSLAGDWLLLSSWKIRRFSFRGGCFALFCSAPALLLVSGATFFVGNNFFVHWIWAFTHFAAALYFGERFAEACRRATKAA
jgi:hypothetical protein